MKRFRLFATAAAIAAVSVTPVAAQGKSGAAPKGGKQPTTSAAPTNHGQSQKVAGNTSSSTTTSPAATVPRGVRPRRRRTRAPERNR